MKQASDKKVYYHGTSADNLQSILKHGLTCSETKLWNVSCDEVYLWDAEAVGKCNDMEDPEDYEREAFRMASQAGQTACITSKDCRVVVIKIELDQDEVSEDLSCENMAGQGAVCIGRTILPSEFLEIQISNDLSLLKAHFIALIMDNQYLGIEFSPLELKVGEAFKKAEIYPEDVDDMVEWEAVPLPSAKRSKQVA